LQLSPNPPCLFGVPRERDAVEILAALTAEHQTEWVSKQEWQVIAL